MTTINNIDAYISQKAPKALSEPWDNDGIMLCKNPMETVKTALVCLEINDDAIQKAKTIGATLIITHHPFIFKPLKNITGNFFSQIELLITNNISVLSYHTRMDKAQNGVNDALAEALELKNVSTEQEILRVGELATPLNAEEFARHIQNKLGCGKIKAFFQKNSVINKVAVCGGAGKDYLNYAALVADAYVSADFSHNTFIDAQNIGLAIYDAGHYFTETPIVAKLQNELQSQFPNTEFVAHNVGSPFFVI